MEKEKIIEIINENNDSIFLTGGVSVEQIGDIENKLNVSLPDSYKWFLEQYGEGILLGNENLWCRSKRNKYSFLCPIYGEIT
ncbi:SMI1/KNR4 family protein [Peribacillus frigoritolerans]|uniref:SMI1/KNR4 family protein n=1 Tax=Peribacillus frigoritolerans TaxID=450367 RepID=UPI0025709139|nr:SMI1/KNR4 family protein [Peribacillus frigoritolerans]WJE46694.1 SMI1/KNR4 family protein [Peribacillus frigoritolerans]